MAYLIMKKKKQTSSGLSRRLRFPEDEGRYPWLPLLLDAYAIADTGVAIAIRNLEKKQKKRLACGKGCGTCCIHQTDLPLYPHEIVGIYWYVTEKMEDPVRDVLRRGLADRTGKPGCPFLIEHACSIHPMRPMGCRQFNVFTHACSPGEDPYFTRRKDVLDPDQGYLDRAFEATLPFYNMKKDGDAASAIRTVRAQVLNLLSFDWSKLIALIDKGPSSSESSAQEKP